MARMAKSKKPISGKITPFPASHAAPPKDFVREKEQMLRLIQEKLSSSDMSTEETNAFLSGLQGRKMEDIIAISRLDENWTKRLASARPKSFQAFRKVLGSHFPPVEKAVKAAVKANPYMPLRISPANPGGMRSSRGSKPELSSHRKPQSGIGAFPPPPRRKTASDDAVKNSRNRGGNGSHRDLRKMLRGQRGTEAAVLHADLDGDRAAQALAAAGELGEQVAEQKTQKVEQENR